jgi:competence protein ComEC
MGRSALAGMLLLLWSGGPVHAQKAPVELIFLDVGQGDAVVIRSPEGKVALIDAGETQSIVYHLQSHGIDSIDLAVATHPHADHIGGMAAVIRRFPVRYYMDNGVHHTTSVYYYLAWILNRSNVVYLEPTSRTIALGSVQLRVLPPPAGDSLLNDGSIGLVVEYGDFRALLTGDSEIDELNHFLALGVPDVTVLKAAHHGSRNGVSPAWLSATKPEVVAISVGKDNPYGHPHPWALRYYEAVTNAIYRTDQHGEVTIRGNADGTFEVQCGHPDGVTTAPPLYTERAPLSTVLHIRVVADAPGNDHLAPNGEYVVLRNAGTEPVSIAAWTLCDAAAHCFVFPSGSRIEAADSITVYTGSGRNHGHAFFMNRRQAVWNNYGDVATLQDAAGNVVLRYEY